VALDVSVTDQRARLYREGSGGNIAEYFHLYVGDVFTKDRLTLNLGVRYDRQAGFAKASQTQSNKAFPNLVPGIDFAGYDSPFTWNNFSPRVGVSYALDDQQKTLLRASFTRYAGQLATGVVGFLNPAAAAGFVDYPWVDLNGDHLAQAGEVRTDLPFISFGGGFNPANPTAVTSPNRIDPDLKAPVNTGLVVGVDRELRPDLAVTFAYTYGRASNLGGGSALAYTPWVGLTAANYLPGPTVSGTLPDGSSYSIPTLIPDAAVIAANGNARILTNYDGFYTSYHGLEAALNKRMSKRWMMRLGFAYNNAREYYDMNPAVNDLGNPTRTDTSPLVQGGQNVYRTLGSGAGDVFINAKWQVNLSGVYQLPYDMEVAGNLFGRHGNPFPFFRSVSLGRDGPVRVLVNPEIDSVRFEDIWNLDVRFAKALRFDRGVNLLLVADLFNVFNGNYPLNRQRNIASPNFNVLSQTLSPRIVRFGIRFGF
jgi:hypothetical protein